MSLIKKDDWRFLIIVIFLVSVFSNIPQIIGKIITPENKYFLSIPVCNSADTVSHLSWIKQGKDGNFLFENKYTTEFQKKIIFHPLFLFYGKFSKIFNLQTPLIFIISRIISTIFLFLALYLLISFFIKDKLTKKIAILLIFFSSGLGGYLVVVKIFNPADDILNPNYPIDLWIPEAITGFGIYNSPLITFSLALILIIFYLFLLSETKNYYLVFLSSFLFIFLGLIHPYDVFIVLSVIILYSLYSFIFQKNKKIIFYCIIFIILNSPIFLYQLYITLSNPILKNWILSPRISPSILSIFLGYGFFIPFIFYNIIKNKFTDKFLFIWVITTLIIIFIPVSFQRRLIEGLHIPICIISAPAILELSRKYFLDYKKAIRIFIILTSFSNISIITSDIKIYAQVSFPYYLDKELIDGFSYLDKNSNKDDIVLPFISNKPSYAIGNLIPAFSGNRTYFGHYDLTVNIKEKIKNSEILPKNKISDDKKYGFLRNNNIKYIFVYCKNSYNAKLFNYHFTKIVYKNSKIRIYKIL